MMDTSGDAAAAVDAPSSAPSSRTLDVTVCTVLQRERERELVSSALTGRGGRFVWRWRRQTSSSLVCR